MGWSGGTDVMWGIMNAASKLDIPSDEKVLFYQEVIEVLQNRDWDCACECANQGDSEYDLALERVRRAWCKKKGYNYEAFYEIDEDDNEDVL